MARGGWPGKDVFAVDEETTPTAVPAHAGECADCAFARAIANRRGSVFVLCERAKTDSSFTRYPRLPVRGCVGYTRTSA